MPIEQSTCAFCKRPDCAYHEWVLHGAGSSFPSAMQLLDECRKEASKQLEESDSIRDRIFEEGYMVGNFEGFSTAVSMVRNHLKGGAASSLLQVLQSELRILDYGASETHYKHRAHERMESSRMSYPVVRDLLAKQEEVLRELSYVLSTLGYDGSGEGIKDGILWLAEERDRWEAQAELVSGLAPEDVRDVAEANDRLGQALKLRTEECEELKKSLATAVMENEAGTALLSKTRDELAEANDRLGQVLKLRTEEWDEFDEAMWSHARCVVVHTTEYEENGILSVFRALRRCYPQHARRMLGEENYALAGEGES